MKTDKRFDKLLISVHKMDESQDIIEGSSVLMEYEAYRKFKSKFSNQVIKYIVYLYDKNSPLIRDYRDLAERKDAALILAGFTRQHTGQWSKTVRDMKELKNDVVLELILIYMDVQHHMKMDMIHVFEQMFLEYREHLLRPVTITNNQGAKEQKDMLAAVDQKKKLREECMAIKKDLDILYEEVYGDNEDLLSNEIQMELRRSTPETVALQKTA
jgi:hypothetical protein